MVEAWERSIRRVALGSDHAAFELKEAIKKHLQGKGVEAIDCGTHSTETADYPDYAEKVASLVSKGTASEGILVCGTGIGMSITANKYPNIRAAVVVTPFMAKSCRGHNDANILCLGARIVDIETALNLVDIFLAEPFEGGRHARRVEKMKQLDKGIVPPGKLENDAC
jgi:ribose 5-phosphate isomerase B